MTGAGRARILGAPWAITAANQVPEASWQPPPAAAAAARGGKLRHHYLRQNRSAYVMILVPLLIYLAFKYVPMFGVIIALQDYNPGSAS